MRRAERILHWGIGPKRPLLKAFTRACTRSWFRDPSDGDSPNWKTNLENKSVHQTGRFFSGKISFLIGIYDKYISQINSESIQNIITIECLTEWKLAFFIQFWILFMGTRSGREYPHGNRKNLVENGVIFQSCIKWQRPRKTDIKWLKSIFHCYFRMHIQRFLKNVK